LRDLKSKNWRELIRPKKIEVQQDSYTNFYGKFVCEPLERGFGITIGNSLRRILLSSLQGAAIVSVKFDGVLHEFSTIPGVHEDVTDIILNLKEIKLKLLEGEEAVIHLISDKEVILSLNKITKKKRKRKASIILDELKAGDLVVHENYGVGLFKGLQNTTVLGSTRDFVVIEYQGSDKLLLPVENLDVIDRYISDGGHLAVVDKLGKGSFTKLKAKRREKLLEIASEIIAIAAKREMIEAASLYQQKKNQRIPKRRRF